MQHKMFFLALGLLSVLFGPLRMASAAQVTAYNNKEMIQHSTLIVWAKVERQELRIIGPHKRWVTDNTLRVRRLFKGRLKTRLLVVRCLGGRRGNLVSSVPGAGKLKVGEEVLVYLEAAQPIPWEPHPTFYYLTGMAYGLWKMRWSNAQKRYLLSRPLDLPTRVAPDPHGRWHALPPPRPVTLALGVIVHQIKQLRRQLRREPVTRRPVHRRLTRKTQGKTILHKALQPARPAHKSNKATKTPVRRGVR